jgi:hypothetical protein
MTKAALLLTLLATVSLGCNRPGVKGIDDHSDTPTDSDDPSDTDDPVDPDAEPPVAVAVLPASARVGDAVTLDGSGSTDPQGYELTGFDWSCTDGSTATGAVVELTFSAAAQLECTLEVTSASGLSAHDSATLEILDQGTAKWTFMVYVAADNNLEGNGLEDVNEMERVGSTDQVNIVVQIDRSRNYSSADGNWDGSRRYLIEQDSSTNSIGSAVVEDLGTVDSGDPDTLAEFAVWGVENYPAEHYALVLWNHGWGWDITAAGGTKGVASDDNTGNDISVARGELASALASVTERIGGPLDLLGMDACLMGSWEVGYEASPYAGIYVASQASEGLDGWAYDTALADLVADPDMSAATLGDFIAMRFNETHDSTQSVVDLGATADLASALDQLALAMMDSGHPRELLEDGADRAQDFEHGWGADHDIGDFLIHLESSSHADATVLEAIQAVRTAYEASVLSNYTWGNNVRDATGMSIYTPTYGRIDSDYHQGSWASDTLWDDFLDLARSGN